MKKILILLSIITFGLVSCEDELNQVPISEKSSGSFFLNESDFAQAVNGIYRSLSNYPERQFYLSDIRSDNIYGVSSQGVRDWDPINNFAVSLATNFYMSSSWNTNFNGIMKANTVLDKLSPDVIPDAAKLSQFEGETKYLRALFYFDLVKLFGKVPVIDHLVTPTEALDIPRSPVSDVYDLIISDLQTAIAKLPPSYGSADIGRATSYAAKGLLARVYLTRSGPALHPDGPCLDTNEYSQALSLLNDIIGGPFSMITDDYASIFTVANENNSEIVFDIQYISGGLGLGASYPGELQSQQYWREAGFPFAIGLENKDVSENLITSYGTTDERFAANITLGYTDPATSTFVYDPGVSKFCSTDPADWGTSRTDFPINFPVLRITDVLMMKAECILQGASGSQADVDNIVNDVRDRAGLGPIAGVTLDQLLEERRKEFLGEGLRWNDLVRTGKVIDVMNAWIPTENPQNQIKASITANDIIYPVPQDQMDVKNGLYQQNPGYN